MSNKVKIDFYVVQVPEGSDSFEKVIKIDSETEDDDSRNAEVHGYPVRLQQAHFGRELIEAEMLRIQMANLPPKAKLNGKVEDLGLDDDEGIGGETAFLYHPRTKVITLQRNRSGVSAKMLTQYFEKKSGLESPITLLPVIQSDALKRLATMKEMKRLRVRFAGITNRTFFRQQDKGLGEMIDILEFYRAPSATIELSMGHQPGSLLAQRIVTLGRHIVGLPDHDGGEVTTMEVAGILEDNSRDEFDLLSYRMVEVVNVEENRNRRSTYKKRRPEILQAWNRRQNELSEMFGS
jgi:hypothetical protein